jgi:hypothetical protein
MQAPTPPALATLAAAVHAGRWAEVRTIGETFPAPVPPAVALALARAQRASGDEVRALAGLAAAIPNAGELAPALRVEAAQVALAVGRDPTPWLAPLLGRSTPTSLRHTAERTLRQAWQELPLALARHARPAHLARALRREMALTLAVREHDTTAALQALAEEGADQAALRAAVSLAAQPDLPTAGRISVAGALLGGGEWRRAHALLAAIGPPADRALHERWAFLSGRAAYRLGELSEAAAHFADAWSTAATSQERFAAAVQRARVAELRDDDAAALGFWDAARRSAPREVEGWDGGARSRAALGRFAAAVALLHHAPRGWRRSCSLVAKPNGQPRCCVRCPRARVQHSCCGWPRAFRRGRWTAPRRRLGRFSLTRVPARGAVWSSTCSPAPRPVQAPRTLRRTYRRLPRLRSPAAPRLHAPRSDGRSPRTRRGHRCWAARCRTREDGRAPLGRSSRSA